MAQCDDPIGRQSRKRRRLPARAATVEESLQLPDGADGPCIFVSILAAPQGRWGEEWRSQPAFRVAFVSVGVVEATGMFGASGFLSSTVTMLVGVAIAKGMALCQGKTSARPSCRSHDRVLLAPPTGP